MSTASTAATMNGLKQSFSTFWAARNKREQNLLALAAVIIVFGLFYMLLIDPALDGRKNLEKALPGLRQQSAELQSMARDASALAGKSATSAPAPALTREGIEASLADKGLKPQSVLLTGEMVKIQFSAVSFAGIVDWLQDAQKTLRLSVVDASVDAQQKPDTVNASLTLRQQGGGQSQ
jgi:general secretion pathway protein M